MASRKVLSLAAVVTCLLAYCLYEPVTNDSSQDSTNTCWSLLSAAEFINVMVSHHFGVCQVTSTA